MKRNLFRQTALGLIALGCLTIACRHDKHDKLKTPADYLRESEAVLMPAIVDLPDNSPKGNVRVATYYAEGVQKYKAQPKAGTNPVQYEWVFVAPQADLYDASNKKVGTHGAGPFWQLLPTDSLFAQPFSPAKNAPSPDAGSIDWLLLKPKVGTTPTGLFAGVEYIQRIATGGEKAPLIPPASATETADIKYIAVYRFSKKNP